ncbi:hypothetical protein DSO57_1008870 [Entomophthora muscae]|uniref:Uncharacterized protein n=1 Tax=Entomophthora muscae TaxID=34485 RepID=A0ACC2RYA2_9FUNG|nr:hypothetical protein DSO57_1008870 [Entomophthora muscae]
MVSGALFLPGKISELLALISKRSIFDSHFEPEKNRQHVIVCGNFTNNCLYEFLREFFCEDHGLQTVNTNVVILNSAEPSEELVSILNDPVYSSRVQYVKGLPTSYKSLKKVRASLAKACFVLTGKNSSDDDREADATAVMLALAIKRFNKGLRLYAQVNLPENKPHFDHLARQLVCLQELRLGMLAQNLLNPGFSTLIYLLATSMTDTTYDELLASIKQTPELPWLEEYVHGATHEIYSISISSFFAGMTFIAVAETIYKHFGATLFALNLSTSQKNDQNVLLNPSSYIIKGGEDGFIMSSSAYDANQISRLGEQGNTLKEFASIFEEELPSYLDESLNDEPASLEPIQETPELHKTSTKESVTSDLADVPKRPLVLQLDGNSSDDSSGADAPPNTFDSVASSEKDAGPDLTLQERNINKVISEMVKENSYSSALKGINELSGHVVICDSSPSFPRSMEYFVGPFRAPHLQKWLPIVILTLTPPSDNQRYLLEQFDDVYFLCGSPLSRKSLFSAGVSRASRAVVLCHDTASTRNGERTVDATSLLTVLNMESMALDPQFFVVVEFIYRENMKLVGAGETISTSEKYSQALLRPAFMSGHVVAPCMLEPLICQAYYNDSFLAVIDCLVFDSSLDKWRNPENTKKRKPSSSQPSTSQTSYLPLSHIFTFEVPSVFYNRPYFHLFLWLLREHSAVTLGIFRTRIFKGRQLSYVVTNPKPNLPLVELDKVYIVSKVCPRY